MGCFLIITEHDLAQLSATMKSSIGIMTHANGGKAVVEIGDTAFQSARQMADTIRAAVPDVKVTSAPDGVVAIPTAERLTHTMATLSQVAPSLTWVASQYMVSSAKSLLGTYYKERGDLGQQLAARVLGEYQGLTINHITTGGGIDITARGRAGNTVVAEVKTVHSTDDFSSMLKVYGERECSDEWFESRHPDLDLDRTTVLGVHINPVKRTLSIYRRLDANARVWKCLLRNAPLIDFDLQEMQSE